MVYDRRGKMVFVSEEARRLLDLEDLPSVPGTGIEDTFIAYRASSQEALSPGSIAHLSLSKWAIGLGR